MGKGYWSRLLKRPCDLMSCAFGWHVVDCFLIARIPMSYARSNVLCRKWGPCACDVVVTLVGVLGLLRVARINFSGQLRVLGSPLASFLCHPGNGHLRVVGSPLEGC